MVHTAAQTGFTKEADAYVCGRPDYPPARWRVTRRGVAFSTKDPARAIAWIRGTIGDPMKPYDWSRTNWTDVPELRDFAHAANRVVIDEHQHGVVLAG